MSIDGIATEAIPEKKEIPLTVEQKLIKKYQQKILISLGIYGDTFRHENPGPELTKKKVIDKLSEALNLKDSNIERIFSELKSGCELPVFGGNKHYQLEEIRRGVYQLQIVRHWKLDYHIK